MLISIFFLLISSASAEPGLRCSGAHAVGADAGFVNFHERIPESLLPLKGRFGKMSSRIWSIRELPAGDGHLEFNQHRFTVKETHTEWMRTRWRSGLSFPYVEFLERLAADGIVTNPSSARWRTRFEIASEKSILSRISDISDVALGGYSKRGRSFMTPEFAEKAKKLWRLYLPRSSMLRLTTGLEDKLVAVVRFAQVHWGMVRITDLQTQKTRTILGSAEAAYEGLKGRVAEIEQLDNGRWSPTWSRLREPFDLDQHINELAYQPETAQQVQSKTAARESFLLPAEYAYNIQLPRETQFLEIGEVEVGGRRFRLEFSHGVMIEPGLLNIEKEYRVLGFEQVALWMSRANLLTNLPSFVPKAPAGIWTYNDLPLYVAFGFKPAKDVPPLAHDPRLIFYQGSSAEIQQSLLELFGKRRSESSIASLVEKILVDMSKFNRGEKTDDFP